MNMQVNGAGTISTATIQSLDLETAMMAVQSNRANLLETQLKDQIASVQAKNDQVAKLNTVLSQLNAMASKFPSDASATTVLKGSKDGGVGIKVSERTNLDSALNQVGLKLSVDTSVSGSLYKVPKSEWDGMIAKVKGQIDSLSNTQQMDMLRLQSLSNKRNEAFDIMTNFIKKMQDSRSSILGNMR